MTIAKEKAKKRKKAQQKKVVEQVQLMIDFSLLLATTAYIRAASISPTDNKARELMIREDFSIIEKVLQERGFKQDNIDFILLDTLNVVMGNLGFAYDEKRLLAAIERIKKATSQRPA